MKNTTSASSGKRFPSPLAARRGLGIVELLVCMGISSMLLTAVGFAYLGSFNSYRDSQERGQMLNLGRGFMNQIIADIRMSDAGGPYDPDSTVNSVESLQFADLAIPGNPNSGPPSAGGSGAIGITLVKTHADGFDSTASVASPVTITYQFDSTNKQIVRTRTQGGTNTVSIACSCVQNFKVYLQPVLIPANAQTGAAAHVALLRAVVNTTMQNKDANGKQLIANGSQLLTLVLSDAAMPRCTFGGI
jgi:Tfp pilus assembly protein PilW